MISGTLVTLGPILPTDFESLFRWANDKEAARLNDVYRPADWRSQQEYWLNIGKNGAMVVFAIRKNGAPAIVGYIQITNIDPVHRSAMISIRIGDAVNRGHGYGREALALAQSYCWNHLNLSRIGLTVFQTNGRAIGIYAAAGFEQEGVLRKAVFIDGQWVDVVVMAINHPTRTNATPSLSVT